MYQMGFFGNRLIEFEIVNKSYSKLHIEPRKGLRLNLCVGPSRAALAKLIPVHRDDGGHIPAKEYKKP